MIVGGCFNSGNQSLENGRKGNGVHHQRMSNERKAGIENMDLTRSCVLSVVSITEGGPSRASRARAGGRTRLVALEGNDQGSGCGVY
jgi:hypothetical protein